MTCVTLKAKGRGCLAFVSTFLKHARLTLVWLALALAAKALVPVGFMLSVTGERISR